MELIFCCLNMIWLGMWLIFLVSLHWRQSISQHVSTANSFFDQGRTFFFLLSFSVLVNYRVWICPILLHAVTVSLGSHMYSYSSSLVSGRCCFLRFNLYHLWFLQTFYLFYIDSRALRGGICTDIQYTTSSPKCFTTNWSIVYICVSCYLLLKEYLMKVEWCPDLWVYQYDTGSNFMTIFL